MKFFFTYILQYLIFSFFSVSLSIASEIHEPLHPEWSFQGPLGTFERASLQRGYQVYSEVCSSCHSMDLLSYRNLVDDANNDTRVFGPKYWYGYGTTYYLNVYLRF